MSYGPNGPSLIAAGAAAAPAAAASIVTLPAIVIPGTYQVKVSLKEGPTATLVAADINNMGLYKNNVLVGAIPCNEQGGDFSANLALIAGDILAVKAIANATAATSYAASITATQLTSVAS
jgi:hypothetical protein